MRSTQPLEIMFTLTVIASSAIAQCPGGYGVVTPPPIPVYLPTDTVIPNEPATPNLPSTDRPNLPVHVPTNTSLPGKPVAPRSGGPTTPRGIALDFSRDQDTERELMVDWQVVVPPAVEQPLSWERAVAVLAAGDDRPLLVRRRAHPVEADQAARIREVLDDEEVKILSRWFHCVDLPDSSRHPAHPLSGLYVPEQPPVMFVVDRNAGNPRGFSGFESANEIKKGIRAALERNYQGDPGRAVRDVSKLLSEYDRLFAKERDLMLRRDQKLENGDPQRVIDRLDAGLLECREQLERVRAAERAIIASLKRVPIEPEVSAARSDGEGR